MMNLDAKILAACGAFALITGCASEHVDLGDDTSPAVLGASLSDYQGDWEGYAEAYRWNDDTDKIRLSLDGTGHGVLEVGDSDPLPAPDAEHGYPPNANGSGNVVSLIAGFSYPLVDAEVESSRIRLKTVRGAIYEEWCSLLPSVPDEANAGQYWCVPNIGISQDGGQCFVGTTPETPGYEAIDCGLLECMRSCRCTEDGCGAAQAEPDLVLDAALDDDGEVLEGTLLENGERITVRMTLTH